MLTHKGTQRMETERLILRKARPEDAEAMFRNWASDPEVTKYLTWPAHESLEVTRWVIGSWIEGYEKDDCYQWMIVPKKDGVPIGTISVVEHSDRLRKAEVGYCIGRNWWRRGYTTEALSAVMDFLFDEVGMNRIQARHDPCNPHSGAVMRKCGMQYEGTSRQSDRNNQGICDAAYYAMLAQDRRKP